MDKKELILIVEDEEGISKFITAILTSNQYRTFRTDRGEEALSITASQVPDLILLDLGLPDIDGLEVLQSLRQWTEIPIIVVSARSHEREKVEALDLGADDYMTKPFGSSELLARIRTAIRHGQRRDTGNRNAMNIYTVGEFAIDYEKRLVTIRNQAVHLTPNEYKIIVLLSKHAGKVLTHDYLIKQVWGPYANENQTLRVNLANIRRKLEINPAEPEYILTEIGVGYRMVEELSK